jgi:mRNA-degrading endonuclease toxin of MazEF toxin-antitoxin module
MLLERLPRGIPLGPTRRHRPKSGRALRLASAVLPGPPVTRQQLPATIPALDLAPWIGARGFANVMMIEAVLRRRLDVRIGLATPEEMEQVSNALRAAQDL